MATQEEQDLYFEARNRALERLTDQLTMLHDFQNAFREGMLAASDKSVSLTDIVDKHLPNLRSESNFTLPFLCGVICILEGIKGKSYAASWMRRGEESVKANVDRKYDRVDAIMHGARTGETLATNLGDLAVYSLKWIGLRAELSPEEIVDWLNEIRKLQ